MKKQIQAILIQNKNNYCFGQTGLAEQINTNLKNQPEYYFLPDGDKNTFFIGAESLYFPTE